MKLESKIEAILFYKTYEVAIKKLAVILGTTEEEIERALKDLQDSLKERGLTLVRKENEVMLTTNVGVSTIIEKLAKEELSKDIGKAGLETLAIVLYKEHVTRSEIDYIRGVNSSFILRNLLIRGLLERIQNPKDSRGFVYKPTFELMQYLGISTLDELPSKENIIDQIENFQNQKQKIEEETITETQ